MPTSNTLFVALLFALGASPLVAGKITTVEQAKKIAEDATSVYVSASGQTLADIVEALVDRAPDITEFEIFHGANSSGLPGRPLKHLAKLKSLTSFKFTGDPSVYVVDFEDIGKLTTLTSLHLSLP